MRLLIISCLCLAFVKCQANDGSKSPLAASSIRGMIGSPVLISLSSPKKRQVSQADVRIVSSATSSSPSSASPVARTSNQILGVLQPSLSFNRGNDILAELLPEFIAVAEQLGNKLEEGDLTRSELTQPENGRTQAEAIVKSFIPLMRKVMAKNAEAEGRSLAPQDISVLNFAEKVVGPFVNFGYDISNYGRGFTDPLANPGLLKNNLFTDLSAEMMVDLIPELTRFVLQIKNRFGGWPGADRAVEVMNLFLPFGRRVVESQAKLEGRYVTEEEQAHLRFNEEVMPTLLKYAEEAFKTGKGFETAEKYNIAEVVENALAKLNVDSSF